MRPLLLLLTISLFTTIAGAATLFPGVTMQINFTTSSPSCPSGTCDALIINPDEQGAFNVNGSVFSLFNGTTLLGTSDDPCCFAIFRSSTSLSTQGTVVDFTSIDNGTIDGIIDFQITSGMVTWPGDPTPLINVAHATSSNGYADGTGLTVTSVQILAPEPQSIFMVVPGFALLLLFGKRRGIVRPFRA